MDTYAGRPPEGFRFAGVACGLRRVPAAGPASPDLALVVSDRACTGAATFTQNAFAAAPVIYDRDLLARNPEGLRAVAINAGIANACTGDAGLADAAAMAATVEGVLGLPRRSCGVMSTGVIGPRLRLERIEAGVRLAADLLSEEAWREAALAIMTTDTHPKTAFRQAGSATLFGMAKGAGMIHPNMATMLALIVTDAAVNAAELSQALRQSVAASFNCISVDGDTSTNDTVLVLANGAAGQIPPVEFSMALESLCTDLAMQIVRDGEGATKLIAIHIAGAANDADARRAARAVANSPLVKTAFYGGDANWGRILAAVGYSGTAINPGETSLWIAPGTGEPGEEALLQLVRSGTPLDYSEEAASAIFSGSEITVLVDLGSGEASATAWTCDLSHEYVSINGRYRT